MSCLQVLLAIIFPPLAVIDQAPSGGGRFPRLTGTPPGCLEWLQLWWFWIKTN